MNLSKEQTKIVKTDLMLEDYINASISYLDDARYYLKDYKFLFKDVIKDISLLIEDLESIKVDILNLDD